METKLTYQEISDIVEKYMKHTLSLSYIGPQTVHVRYKFFEIDLTVEDIDGSDIIITYAGGKGVCLLVRGALLVVKNRSIGSLIEEIDDNRVRLRLSENTTLSTVCEHVNIENIGFYEQYAVVQVSVKR